VSSILVSPYAVTKVLRFGGPFFPASLAGVYSTGALPPALGTVADHLAYESTSGFFALRALRSQPKWTQWSLT